MPRIRAAVFDMDGLLIDTEPVWRQVEIEVFGSVGLRLTEEQLLETMGVRVAQVVELWHRRHPWHGPTVEEITQRIVQGVADHVAATGEPKPGVLRAFEIVRAAGLPIAIASSSSEVLIETVLRRLGLRKDVQVICSAENEAEGKPHPAVYLRAAECLASDPEACLAFEDSPNGVLSAKAAGMYCIVVPDPHLASDPRMAEADMRLESLEEFTPELLEKLVS